jgi:hypothetical protein
VPVNGTVAERARGISWSLTISKAEGHHVTLRLPWSAMAPCVVDYFKRSAPVRFPSILTYASDVFRSTTTTVCSRRLREPEDDAEIPRDLALQRRGSC